MQVFVEMRRQSFFALSCIIFELGEQLLPTKPFTPLFKLLQKHENHSPIIYLLINVIEKRLNVCQPKSLDCFVVLPSTPQHVTNLNRQIRPLTRNHFFDYPMANGIVFAFRYTHLGLSGERIVCCLL